MSNRQDYSRQCASEVGGVSEEQLSQGWCQRCLQVECVRSSLGRDSRFEDRVLNWHERLFVSPSRMSPNDPRFLPIARQGFLTIDMGPIPEVRTSAWHDPRDLASELAVPTQAVFSPPSVPVQAPPPLEPPAVAALPLETTTVPPATVPATAPRPVPTQPQRPQVALNAPNAQGRMIERPLSAPALPPVADPWSGPVKPTPSTTNEVVVQRGARIKLG